jgi:hypothetical protein
MAQKRKEESEFKVSDKRLFTSEGELRDSTEEQTPTPVAVTAAATAAPAPPRSRGGNTRARSRVGYT